MPEKETVIGVVSDTHGRLPDEVREALAEVDLIIHAGDFDTPPILEAFREMGELKAVRGNMDRHSELVRLPETRVVQVEEVFIYVLHDILKLDIDPKAAGMQVVVHGHLHTPSIVNRDGVLYLNPGSPTSPRMGTKPGVALLRVKGSEVEAELVEI